MFSYTLQMETARAKLARQILEMLAHGHNVPESDALQLRNWAVHPEDAMLPLEEIAYRILKHGGHSHARVAKQ
jgi:hypothetical protein